VVLVVLV